MAALGVWAAPPKLHASQEPNPAFGPLKPMLFTKGEIMAETPRHSRHSLRSFLRSAAISRVPEEGATGPCLEGHDKMRCRRA